MTNATWHPCRKYLIGTGTYRAQLLRDAKNVLFIRRDADKMTATRVFAGRDLRRRAHATGTHIGWHLW